ncbi:MAG TPA: hypothetical protein VIF62_22780 [Labilithrix sp.]|jgi:hypothetical protein
MRALRLLVVLLCASVGAYAACRAEDPKTPPNSPFPEVDRPSDPAPSLLEAGASSAK